MSSQYSEAKYEQVLRTLTSMEEALEYIFKWHENTQIATPDDYLTTPGGIQLLAATAMHITAVGEGITRIYRIDDQFLPVNFPQIPWGKVIDMRNRIAHGYFEIDEEVVFHVVRKEIGILKETIHKAIEFLKQEHS